MIDDRSSKDPEQDALAQCILAIGTPTFYRALLRFAQVVCGFEHLSVFGFTPTFERRIVVLEGLDDPSITSLAAKSYMGFGYHSFDPALARIRELGQAADAPAVLPLWARDIKDAAYRRGIYEKWGLDGRVSLIGRAGGHWRSVNFYKHVQIGGLTEEDVLALTKRAQVLFAAETRHLALSERHSPPGATVPTLVLLENLLTTIAPTLSRRETEVCARALQGMTGEGTALDLGISDATVATLRRRAYTKLHISNLNELFALCLSSAAQSARRENNRV
jgi:DNA-binding CsgD family transcriptional regulator